MNSPMETHESAPLSPSRSRRIKKAPALTVLAFACIVAYWLGTVIHNNGNARDALEVDSSCLDFGEVWPTKKSVWPLTIKNNEAKELHVLRFVPSCVCLSAQPPHL